MAVFQKGQVNNPHGRPVIPEELKAKLKDGFTEVIQFWFDTLRNDTERWDYRNKAAENIANYGYGKPRESIDIDHSGGITGLTIKIIEPDDADTEDI
jgi:hypothetical protein